MKKILVIGLLAASTGCTTIEMKVPANRFTSPEAKGQLKTQFGTAIQGGNKLVMVPDYTAIPPKTNAPNFERSTVDPRLDGTIGVLDRLDVALHLQGDAPMMLEAKFQAVGDNEKDAKDGNISVAVSVAAGGTVKSDRQKQFFGNTTSSYKLTWRTFDMAAIAGYRVEPFVIYTSFFRTGYTASGEINQPDGSSTIYRFGGSGSQYGWNLGFRGQFHIFFFMVETAWAKATFDTASHSGFYAGAFAGLRF